MLKELMLIVMSFVFLQGIMAKNYKYESVKNDPLHTRIYTLDNGLKIYTSVNKEKPRVTAHIAVNTGHRNDPAETTGLAHYLEHLMFKGSTSFGTTDYAAENPYLDKITNLYEEYRKITDVEARKAKYHEIDSVSQIAAKFNIPNEYDKMMAAIGAEGSNAYTWFDITCYTEDIPSNAIEAWAKIQSDRFQNMVVRGFHTELEAVYEEKNMSLTSDDEKASDALLAKLFPSHSYGTQTTLGTQEHLKNPSIVNILNYYHRYYVPNNVAICMAGDFNPEEVLPVLEKYFGQWKPGKDVSGRTFPAQPRFEVPQDTTVVGQEQESMGMAWRFKAANSSQMDTLSLVAKILSNRRAGLIDLNLNRTMKVQQASVSLLSLKDYSIFGVDVTPKQGQTLEEARDLVLSEVEKLKNGEFDEELLTSIINNEKRSLYNGMESNRNRVSTMVDAFINGKEWKDVVERIGRLSKINKTSIVKWAQENINEGYAIVYKRQGEDSTIKKIEKPAITAIPTNRDYKSKFLTEIVNTKMDPIQPVFMDFKKDLGFARTKNHLPVIYKQNVENGLFQLVYRYDFGSDADKCYDLALKYLPLLGTEKYSADELKKKFYNLACDYHVMLSSRDILVSLSGLAENMPEALALLDDLLHNAKVDEDVYNQYVDKILKRRADAKKEQQACASALYEYAMYGADYVKETTISEKELKQISPPSLVDMVKNLCNVEHQVLYYGPMSQEAFCTLISKQHKVAKQFVAAPVNKNYKMQTTPSTEVLLAPYDAPNIHLRMYHNEDEQWKPEHESSIRLFNEYFGGGMNSIVFQELRESRGLAYNAGARYATSYEKVYPEYWIEQIVSQNDKMMDCIRVFADITSEMPQSYDAFNVAKQNLLKNIQSQRTTKFGVISSYIDAKKRGIDYDINKMIYETLPKMQLADIVNFEKSKMANKPMRYIILGNEKQLNMDALEKIGHVKKVSLETIFGY